MMVPRSYYYTIPGGKGRRSGSPAKRHSVSKDPEPQSYGPLRSKETVRKSDLSTAEMKPTKLSQAPAPCPSMPMVIPTRTRRPGQKRRENPEPVDVEVKHDPDAISPSMAALLAMSSLQQPRSPSLRQKKMSRTARSEYFEKLTTKDLRHTMSSCSPRSWSILQSPPEDVESEAELSKEAESIDSDHGSFTSCSPAAPLSSFRSFSPDSIPSLEGDLDDDSSFSPGGSPLMRFRSRNRHARGMSPAIRQPSDNDHPLSESLTASDNEDNDLESLTPLASSFKESTPPKAIKGTGFKSNLTASLQLLKSAAKSLSGPSLYPHPSMVTQPIVAHPSMDRSSPVGSSTTLALSPGLQLPGNIDDLPFHLSAQMPPPPPTRFSVQLQAYTMSPRSTASATAPPIFLSSLLTDESHPDAGAEKPENQKRGLRENSSFLKVFVLEMNMRRAGKLQGEGRARLWLEARQELAKDDEAKVEENSSAKPRSPDEDDDDSKSAGTIVFDSSPSHTKPGEKVVPKRWTSILPES